MTAGGPLVTPPRSTHTQNASRTPTALRPPRATGEREHVVSAYLTFVSLDPNTCQPGAVPGLVPESDEEKRRYREAGERRADRRRSKKRGG